MQQNNNILDKIKKLLALAESAQKIGSLSEAENAMSKATALMLEYNIEQADIDRSKGEDSCISEGEHYSFKDNQSGNRWKLELMETLAKHNLCDVLFSSYMKTMRVVGEEQNIAIVNYLFVFIAPRLLKIAQQYHVALPENEKFMRNRRGILQSFLLGAVGGLDAKLWKQKKSMEQQSKLSALVVSHQDKIQRYYGTFEKPVKVVSLREVLQDEKDSLEGYRAGASLEINQGLQAPEKEKEVLKLKR